MTADTNRELRPRPSVIEYASSISGYRFVRGRGVTFPLSRTIMHADYVIKLTTKGHGAPIHYRGAERAPCTSGGIDIFEPFEPIHARSDSSSTSFVSLLVEPGVLHQAAMCLGGSTGPRPQVGYDSHRAIAFELNSIRMDLDADLTPIELEERAASALELLLGPDFEPSVRRAAVPAAVFKTRELIMDRLAENVPMAQLEEAVGLSRFHLVRLFRRHYRLPPHEFRIQARVALARRLLAKGCSQAEVATEAGVFDQSHLHRHFRRIVGISPGAFRNRLGRFEYP